MENDLNVLTSAAKKDPSPCKKKHSEKICQEWDLNPRPFGPVPETGALDQLGHLDFLNYMKIEPKLTVANSAMGAQWLMSHE